VPVVPAPPTPEGWGSSPDTDPPQSMGGMSTEEIREQIARSRMDSSSRFEVSLETAAGPRTSP